MRHALAVVGFVGVRGFFAAARWARTALAGVGLAFALLVAVDPDPVRREAVRRLRLVHAMLAESARPEPPIEGVPPIRWPASTHRVSSGFGSRIHPITGARQVHRGIDLPMPVGTPIVAARPGRVTKVAEDGLNGLHVVIEDPEHGLRFAYAHLSAVEVAVGAPVQAGDRLGRSGNTGRSTGPHLHFGAWVGGRAVDPRRLRTVDAVMARVER